MFLKASDSFALHLEGRAVPRLDTRATVSLRWPDWYVADTLDTQRTANTLIDLVKAKQMSRETALRAIADTYDIEDVAAELRRIEEEST